eukprot:CAMPEP_0172360748 /NCGR_PEP_ID=MMETSP1060-20121228/4723_1 /TAXON_ID=37318 /ORGANISM="Pseudo-nitzschia pungens, Strain cf. cingulata" /LENGTH=847 /DNA_ID=CAMNT_0013082823 /DNA_START=543 /DNA_END=3086 /DNA_ORIENTATION=+
MSSLSHRSRWSRFVVVSLGLMLSWSVLLVHASTSTSTSTLPSTLPSNGAAAATAKPPQLPLGDINVVILTDVHSWVGSHRRQEPRYDADLGNVLSFWEHLKERVESLPGRDQSHRQTVDSTANGNGNGNGNGTEAISETETETEATDPHPHHPPPPMPDEQYPDPDHELPPGPPPDIFLVNNGDFIHGTGLSRMIDGQNDPSALVPLLEKMPYDAVNVGNHELYSKKNIDAMTRAGGYVDWWGDRYLTSNIHAVDHNNNNKNSNNNNKDNNKNSNNNNSNNNNSNNKNSNNNNNNNNKLAPALGNRYKILHGSNGGSRLLAFGFLYDMPDYAPDAGIWIEDVESVIEQEWFRQALTEERYDAILVLAHMDLVDPLVETIRAGIRMFIGDGTPVVFVTGHTHYRGVKQLDDLTMTVEAGRYLDTVGFVSFPRKESIRTEHAASLFKHAFVDANRRVLFEETLGFSRAEDGDTPNGRDLSVFIDRTRDKLGLSKEIGCAPQSYFVERRVDDPESLWGLYKDLVIPSIFSVQQTMATIEEEATHTKDNLPMAMLLSRDDWRYDLLDNAPLIVDDVVAVAPFNDTVVHLGTFSRSAIIQANHSLNENDPYGNNSLLPPYILIDNLDDFDTFVTTTETGSASKSIATTKYHLYTHAFNAEHLQKVLHTISPTEPVDVRVTEFTSTDIWLAFVQESWACGNSNSNSHNGKGSGFGGGKLSPWIPSYQNVVKNLNNDQGQVDRTRLVVAIVVLLVLVVMLSAALVGLWTLFRRYLSYQPVSAAAATEAEDPSGIYKIRAGDGTDKHKHKHKHKNDYDHDDYNDDDYNDDDYNDDDYNDQEAGNGSPAWQNPELL